MKENSHWNMKKLPKRRPNNYELGLLLSTSSSGRTPTTPTRSSPDIEGQLGYIKKLDETINISTL